MPYIQSYSPTCTRASVYVDVDVTSSAPRPLALACSRFTRYQDTVTYFSSSGGQWWMSRAGRLVDRVVCGGSSSGGTTSHRSAVASTFPAVPSACVLLGGDRSCLTNERRFGHLHRHRFGRSSQRKRLYERSRYRITIKVVIVC